MGQNYEDLYRLTRYTKYGKVEGIDSNFLPTGRTVDGARTNCQYAKPGVPANLSFPIASMKYPSLL